MAGMISMASQSKITEALRCRQANPLFRLCRASLTSLGLGDTWGQKGLTKPKVHTSASKSFSEQVEGMTPHDSIKQVF